MWLLLPMAQVGKTLKSGFSFPGREFLLLLEILKFLPYIIGVTKAKNGFLPECELNLNYKIG